MQQRNPDDRLDAFRYGIPPRLAHRALIYRPVPNIWLRPNNKRKEADQAKALLTIPDGDHLTLLNVYNAWKQSTCRTFLGASV